MKISTNNIGNYAPKHVPQIQSKTKPAMVQTEIRSEKITADEKNFFIQMYPQNKTEIADYHFYEKSGKMSGVSLGSLFDKRG